VFEIRVDIIKTWSVYIVIGMWGVSGLAGVGLEECANMHTLITC